MTRRHKYEGYWCTLMAFHLARLRVSATELARRLGLSQQAIHTYLSGKARPPLKDLPKWCGALGLTAAECEQMLDAAYEAHTPAPVWEKLLALRKERDSRNRAECPPEILAELKRYRTALEAAHEALTRLDAWGRTGRPLPGNIAAAIHKAIAVTALPPEKER